MHHKQFPTNNFRNPKSKRATDKPLVSCHYGWKRTCILYNDRIDVDGTMYALDDLVQVRTMYRTVMNVPSVRLELRFRQEDVILRGIAAIEDAKSIVAYLETYCADTTSMTTHIRRNDHRQNTSSLATTGRIETVGPLQREDATDTTHGTMQVQAQAITAPLEAPTWLQNLEQHVIYTRNQQRTKAYRSIRKYGFDVQEVAQEAEADTLPSVAVPLRLLPQETAHYCTEATLSQKPSFLNEQTPAISAAMDHGRLILTSKRAIYIGRTGQIVLDYARLTHVSRLRNAIVFSADSGSKRHVFEMQRPLQCALYLDGILRQFQRYQRPVLTSQLSAYQSQLQPIHSTRTTQLRHPSDSRQARQAIHARPSKPLVDAKNIDPPYGSDLSHPVSSSDSKHIVELEDIETLPLSLLLQHAEVKEI